MKYLKIILFIFLSIKIFGQVNVTLPDTSAQTDATILIPVNVSDLTNLGITSYEFKILFDGDILDAKNINIDGTLSNRLGWSFTRRIRNSSIKVNGSGFTPLSGSGVLIYVKFKVVAKEGLSGLNFDSFKFNDGLPNANTFDGTFSVFNPVQLLILKSGDGDGDVLVNGEVINFPYDSTFNKASSINLEGVPAQSSQFNNWSGDINSTENPISFIINSDTKITANFSLLQFTITTESNPVNGGQTFGSGIYQYGDLVSLSASPNERWRFLNWTEDGTVVSKDANYKFVAIGDRNLSANFEKYLFTISTTPNPQDGGTTGGDGVYELNTDVTLTAISNIGWHFNNWSEENKVVSNDSVYNFTASKDRNLTANFSLKTFLVSAIVIPDNSGLVNGTGNYNYGETAVLQAIPSPGYHFNNWSENGVVLSTDSLLPITVTQERTLTANFSNSTYIINCSSFPSDGGITSGCGFFNYGQIANLNAEPYTGWNFINWTKNGQEVSTERNLTFSVTKSENLIANFQKELFMITCAAEPIDAGITSGCGFFNYNQEAVLIASPNEGWVFDYWTMDGDTVSFNPQYSFQVQGNNDLTAHFSALTSINNTDFTDVVPNEFYLGNAFPNPFNPSTTITFGLPEDSDVTLIITNITGVRIKTLLNKQRLNSGTYNINFNGTNIASGIYFYTILTNTEKNDKFFVKSRKMILLK